MFKYFYNFFYDNDNDNENEMFRISNVKPNDTICIIGDIQDNKNIIKDIIYSVNLKHGQNFFNDGLVISDDITFWNSFIPKNRIEKYNFTDSSESFIKLTEKNKNSFFIREITEKQISIIDNMIIKNVNWKKYRKLLQIFSVPFTTNCVPVFDKNDLNIPSFFILKNTAESIKYINTTLKGFCYNNIIHKGTHIIIDTYENKKYFYNKADTADFRVCNMEAWMSI